MVNIIKKCENNIDYLSMKNEHLEIEVTNLGCTILKVFMKDKDGNIDDVVLCYDDIIHNGRTGTYFGALVGRIANRIKRGKFTLNDKEYTVELGLYESISPLMELSFYAGDRKTAAAIIRNFKANPEKIYGEILASIIGDEEK